MPTYLGWRRWERLLPKNYHFYISRIPSSNVRQFVLCSLAGMWTTNINKLFISANAELNKRQQPKTCKVVIMWIQILIKQNLFLFPIEFRTGLDRTRKWMGVNPTALVYQPLTIHSRINLIQLHYSLVED